MRYVAPIGALLLAACSGGGASDPTDTATTDTGTAVTTTVPTTTTNPTTTNPTTTAPTDPVVEQQFDVAATLDVLFVIDDSFSMAPHQQALADNYPSFADWLLDSGIDVHIGVTTTSVDTSGVCSHPDAAGGRLLSFQGVRWVDDSTPDPSQVFARLSQPGTNGSGCERGLSATRLALDEALVPPNAGFRRADAALHVVVLSDEEDQSDDPTSPQPIEPADIASWLESQGPDPADIALHSIVCDQAGSWGAGQLGSRYLEASQLTGGTVFSIDELDDDTMDTLGSLVLPRALSYFTLDSAPDPATLEVEITDSAGMVHPLVQGPEASGDYSLSVDDAQVVWLHGRPAEPGDVVTIRYEAL
jgi:hypothetical protein